MKVRKFYLQRESDHSVWDEVQIEISPNLVNTLDETLDNLTVNLKINNNENPIRPMLGFELREYDTETEQEKVIAPFIVSGDVVELVTTNPNRYKHVLTLIQKSEYLTKHEIRNTVFSTSLETSQFVQTVARSVIAKFSASVLNLDDAKNTSWENVSYSDVTIDLSVKKIKEMSLKVSFMAQIPYFLNWKVLDNEWHLFCHNVPIESWQDIYQSQAAQPYGTYLPTIVFTHGADTYTWNILSSDLKNGDTIDVPDDIIDWIQQFSSGNLVISIQDEGTTFIKENAFIGEWMIENKIPEFINFSAEFYINAVEMNVYEVVSTMLKQQQKNTKLYHDAEPLFKLPTATHNKELYELMLNTSAPNFVFTQSTFYDALVEIFKLWDAIFAIDVDGYLDIEYFNEHKPTDKPTIIGKSTSHSEERFTNKLLTYFQNTKINDRFPNSNQENATAYIRSKELGVPAESDFVFVVPKPIDTITKVMADVSFELADKWVGEFEVVHFEKQSDCLDITEFVVEENIWTNLPTDSSLPIGGDWNKIGKINTLSYARGSKFIDISGYYNTTVGIKQSVFNNVIQSAVHKKYGTVIDSMAYGNFYNVKSFIWDNHDIKLSVSYIALCDGKVAIESIDSKYSGETLINQNAGSIDINKLGLNMVGLTLKLGQPTLNMTQKFSKWNDRVLKGQYFTDDNGDRWVANNCVYTILKNDLIQANIEFVKNFNALASRIELNREKRLTNISNELTVKCEETYGEYIYYSATEIDETLAPEDIVFNDTTIANQILFTFNANLPTYLNDYISVGYGVANSKVEIKTVANATSGSHTRKKLYLINDCYVENNPDFDFYLVINSAADLSGASLAIYDYASDEDSIYFDELNQTFGFNIGLLRPSLQQYQKISLYLIIEEDGQVLFGALYGTSTPLTTLNFDPTHIESYVFSNGYKIEYALLTALDENNEVITNEGEEVKNIAIPLVSYGSGNSVCFEMSFDSPITAGSQLLQVSTGYWWSPTGWFSKAVLYTDENGKADKFTIDFVMLQEKTTRYFPEMKSASNTYLQTYSFGKLEEFEYCKKPNEIFALNYQLYFLPIPEQINRDFLNNEFIKNNGFVKGINNKTFELYYSTFSYDAYSILDTKGDDVSRDGTGAAHVLVTQVSSSILTGIGEPGVYLRIKFLTSLPENTWNKITAWAICDRKGNIYFASNSNPSAKSANDVGEFSIDFISRHHRLN